MGDVVMTVRFEGIRTTRRGRHDPNFGKRLIFLRGQYAGMEGWYVERHRRTCESLVVFEED